MKTIRSLFALTLCAALLSGCVATIPLKVATTGAKVGVKAAKTGVKTGVKAGSAIIPDGKGKKASD